jgi:nuclear transport factor 2 (NTF2) superfamily protein
METASAAAHWARTWRDAWEARDTDAVLMLYAPDALVSVEAFRPPCSGHEEIRRYVAQVFSEERAPRVWVGAPIVTEGRAAIEWWAAVVENGIEITLAGVSVLRFNFAGLVIEQRDSWNQGAGLREPPTGWGRAARD